MRKTFLLGAGASVKAGVPAAYQMTADILKAFEEDSTLRAETRILHFVVGGLLFRAGVQNANPLQAGVNVEELFSAVEMLSERDTLEAAPFVESWHGSVSELDKINAPTYAYGRLGEAIYGSVHGRLLAAFRTRPSTHEKHSIDSTVNLAIDAAITAAAKGSTSRAYRGGVGDAVEHYLGKVVQTWKEELDRLQRLSFTEGHELERALGEVQARPGEGQMFAATCDSMVRTLAKLVWKDDSTDVRYLAPLVQLGLQPDGVAIASLNYDNCIELACKDQGIDCNTGFDEWSRTGRLPRKKAGVRLLKLHGSIDWRLEPQLADASLPQMAITRVDPPAQGAPYRPAVVFGQRSKLTADGPYLALLAAFEDELSLSDEAVVIGYSFRDDHVNTCLSRWFNGKDSRRLTIVDPYFRMLDSEFIRALSRVRGRSPRRVRVIEDKAEKVLAELLAVESSADEQGFITD